MRRESLRCVIDLILWFDVCGRKATMLLTVKARGEIDLVFVSFRSVYFVDFVDEPFVRCMQRLVLHWRLF